MHKYEIIIYWSETDNAYIAEVPELAGCMADGKTYIETIQNVELVISEWIETALSLGRKIPVPRGKRKPISSQTKFAMKLAHLPDV